MSQAAGFRDTLTISHPDTRLRDKVGRHVPNKPAEDKRDASKLTFGSGRTAKSVRSDLNRYLTSNVPFQPAVIANTHTTIRRTQMNHARQQSPDLRHDYRNETNAIVHQSTRETKAEILQLAKANKAGATESKHLLRTYHLVERAATDRDHLLWILQQSINKRKSRILNERDVVDDALGSEKRMLTTHKRLLQQSYAMVKACVREMKHARAALSEHMRIKRIPLHLNSDAHSGAVEGPAYPLPLEWDPPCVSELAKVFTKSQTIRRECGMMLDELADQVQDQKAITKQALAHSVRQAKYLETELVFAKGQARLQKNTAARNQHTLEITAGRHAGPDNRAQFLEVSEKVDRPMVATYNSAVQHAPGAVSHYEKSQQTSSWFDNTIRQTQNDVADLDLGEKQLSAALHDTKQTKAVDIAIRNVRERFGHRRV